MSVYDTFKQEQKKEKTGGSVYDTYQKALRGSKPTTMDRVSSVYNSLVFKPVKAMSEVFRKPQTPKGWKLAFGSDEAAKRTWDTWSSTIDDSSRRINEMMDAYKNPNYKERFLLKAGVKTASAGVGLVNAAFAGITGAFNALTTVPGVGHIADGVNKVFEAAATGSASIASDALWATPGLDDDTKAELDPVVQELAGLAGMAVVGKGTQMTQQKIKSNTTTILQTLKQRANPTRNVSVRSEGGITTVPISTSKTRFQRYNEEQGYEPYQDPSTLPVIEMGSKPKSDLPTIQIGERKSRVDSEYTYEPIPEAVLREAPEIVADQSRVTNPTYSRFQSETALKLQQDAAKQGLTINETVPFQERMNMMENFRSAEEFVAKDPVRAERVLTKGDMPPADIKIGSIWNALKQKAIAEGDMPLLEKLSRSTVATDSARDLKSFEEVIRSEADPVEALREIREFKATAKNVDVKKEVKKLKKSIKREPITKESWEDFVKSLEC